ncbi:MAG: NAD(P)/FAD-dependent oxidoreductase, partial [Gemmatimonadaceae bacterium]
MVDRRVVDVAVIGAGPAGLAAAVHAAEAGSRVVVVDQSSHLGGQVWRHREPSTLPTPARRWLERFRASGAGYLPQTAVAAAESGALSLVAPAGVIELRARAIVLATGARELFLPFPGWTLPNVFGVGGLQALVKGGLDVRGKRVIIAGSGPLVFPVAATVAATGADLLAVCEQADRRRLFSFAASLWRSPSKLTAALAYRSAFRRTPLHTGTWVERAEGRDCVEQVTLADGRRRWNLPCDLLATACGLIPNVEVGSAMGCSVAEGALVVDAR